MTGSTSPRPSEVLKAEASAWLVEKKMDKPLKVLDTLVIESNISQNAAAFFVEFC